MIIQYTKGVLLLFIITIEVGHSPRHDLNFNVGFKCEVMKPTCFRLLRVNVIFPLKRMKTGQISLLGP